MTAMTAMSLHELHPHPTTAREHAIQEAFAVAGFHLSRQTMYLQEYGSSRFGTIYVLRRSSGPNRISIVVHPRWELQDIENVGHARVGAGYLHHSGMTAFPSRINNGVSPITYGRKLEIDDVRSLGRVLGPVRGGTRSWRRPASTTAVRVKWA